MTAPPATLPPAISAPEKSSEPVIEVNAAPPAGEDADRAGWPDDSAESAFLAESRERGEPVAARTVKADASEEPETKSLPPLDELVGRIPVEVREALDELFRARFVSVKRVPKRALKS